MILELVRIKEGVAPVDDASVAVIKPLPLGKIILCEYKPRRDVIKHRKFFALLKAVILNQERYKTIDNLLEVVKYQARHYETIIPLKGETFIKTKSISFHSMDDKQFDLFYDTALDVCIELVGEDAVNDILKFIPNW